MLKKIDKPVYINHITLSTGHVARTSRAAVAPAVTALLAKWLPETINSGKHHPLPSPDLSHFCAQVLIGYKGRMTGHGWRGVASTWANEAGYPSDHIEAQLAHGSDDAVRSAYNHAAYMPQRRAMLQAWADWLDAQGLAGVQLSGHSG